MKVIAIIPARGGSKGIKNKNIYPIYGKPLISYTIEAAIKSRLLNKIVVSSDSDEILEVATSWREVTLHQRDNKIAQDKSPVTHTVHSVLKSFDESFDAIMLLQPTSPIRTSEQIDKAIQLFEKKEKANSLISVVPMNDTHPARMYWKNEEERLRPIMEKFEQMRRQDIPTAWYRNGSIYMTRTMAFMEKLEIMIKPSIGFEMPLSQLLNIDEPRDILIASVLIEEWLKERLI